MVLLLAARGVFMEQSSMLFQKDGKNYLQLDCENAKELSMKLGEKTYPFTKDGKNGFWSFRSPQQ